MPRDPGANRVFVSHCTEDMDPDSPLHALMRKLADAGCEPFLFQDHRRCGQDILEFLEAEIRRSDVFLLARGPNPADDAWIRRELSLAVSLQKDRNCDYPRILPFTWGGEPPGPVRMLDFLTGEPGEVYDLTNRDVYDLRSPEGMDALVREISETWTVTLLEDSSEAIELLRPGILACYEFMFPPEERISLDWVLDGILEGTRILDGAFAVSHCGRSVAGFACVSFLTGSDWAFGNYLCVLHGFRGNDQAKRLVQAVLERGCRARPNLRGIVFEIEPIDAELLDVAWSRTRDGEDITQDSRLWSRVKAELRSVRRLKLYSRNSFLPSKLVQRRDGSALRTWQPSMADSMDSAEEVLLHMMVAHLAGMKPAPEDHERLHRDVSDILDAVYDDLYARTGYAADIHGYSDAWVAYVHSVKERILAEAADGVRLAPARVPRSADLLLQSRLIREHTHELGI